MKKLLAAVILLGGTAAFAQVDASEVGPGLKKEAKEVGKSARENTKELGKQAGLATEDQGTFKTAHAFDLKGVLKDDGGEEITITRQGLPPAVLDIRDETQIFIDGKKAKQGDLKANMDVTARFQLEGEESVAVRIDAKKGKASKAMGGAGEAGLDESEKDLKNKKDKAVDESKREMNETESEMRQNY